MRRPLLAMALTCAAALLAAPAASADSRTVGDPRGDLYAAPSSGSSGSYDIVSGTFGHKRNNLVHKVTVAGSVADPASEGPVPTLFIEHPTEPNGTQECTYFVGRHGGRLGVFRCGYADRVASARITRTSGSTVRFEFSRRSIGNPPSYEWRIGIRGPAFGTSMWLDRLPDGDVSMLLHRLG